MSAVDYRIVCVNFTEEGARVAEVIEAGRLARAYVIGAMDPDASSPADRDAVVRILAKRRDFDVAAAFLRGWVEHHDDDSRHAEAMRRGEEAWRRFEAAREVVAQRNGGAS